MTRDEMIFLKKDNDSTLYDAEKLVLYSRSDHDTHRWWVKWFDDSLFHCHKDLVGPETLKKIGEEAGRITSELTGRFSKGVSDIEDLMMEEGCGTVSETEGNLFYHGEYANYWIRLIARQKDYNLYVKAFARKEKGEKDMEQSWFEIKESAIKEAMKYSDDEKNRFFAEYGWQPWMNSYVHFDNEPTEQELNEIDKELERFWEESRKNKGNQF